MLTRDVSRPVGRRDRAILTLLVRLGPSATAPPRRHEEDFDWHHAELTVRGKGCREERLPIPPDVGDAVVAYLRGESNRGAEREVFIKARAPFASTTAKTVGGVVRSCRHPGRVWSVPTSYVIRQPGTMCGERSAA